MDILNPVIIKIKNNIHPNISIKERVAYLSQQARKAVYQSALQHNIKLPAKLPKDKNGAPLPVDGTYWSLSHKNDFVVGVVSNQKVGIDIEEIIPRSPGLHRKVAYPEEWDLIGGLNQQNFYRIWTAKEATVKALGHGIEDLLQCTIVDIKESQTLLHYYKQEWLVEHFFIENHILAITKNYQQINWIFVK